MTEMPTIDVLLATYRPDLRFLEAQVESIRRQTGVETNIISREDVDGSGAAANFSALLAESSAQYIAFADQDDVWLEQKLAKLLDCVKRLERQYGSDRPILAFCDSWVTDRELKPLPGTFLSRQRLALPKAMALPRLLMQNFIAGNLMLFNGALRDKAGAVPPGALMHDSWVALVAAAFGVIGQVDEPLLYYRQHGDNTLGATLAEARHCRRRMAEGPAAFAKRLEANIAQARAFCERFGDAAPECVRALADFSKLGYWRRRAAILRHGLFKQGLLRNLALMLWA